MKNYTKKHRNIAKKLMCRYRFMVATISVYIGVLGFGSTVYSMSSASIGDIQIPCDVSTKNNHINTFRHCRFRSGPNKLKGRVDKRLTVEERGLAFLKASGRSMGILNDGNNLRPVSVKRGLTGTHIRYQQFFKGYPINESYVSIHENNNEKIEKIHSTFIRTPNIVGKNIPTISELKAKQIAVKEIARRDGHPHDYRISQEITLVWFQNDSKILTLAWKVALYPNDPLGDFFVYINANNGKILSYTNRMQFFESGSGFVYKPNPVQTSGNTTLLDNNDVAPTSPQDPLNAELVQVVLQGLDENTGLLTGEFVDLASRNSPYCPEVECDDADEANRQYFYDRDNPRFEQVVVYHTIDSIQRYIHSLGYDNDTGIANGIRDFPTIANAHWKTTDESFFDIGDNAVYFGDGGVDDGEDGDIIAHEYGHAIQFDQNECFSSGGFDMGAMGEGFGDYLAASFFHDVGNTQYQLNHAACVGEWDASLSGNANAPNCLRRVDSDKVYSDLLDDPNGLNVHENGKIWSRTLWEIRKALGGTDADKLILEHHFSLPCGSTMLMAAFEIIDVDFQLNQGANQETLRTIFCDRGIMVGSHCQSDTDNDGISDDLDNCVLVANFNQLDTDNDGFGNQCDADFDNSCRVNALDIGPFVSAFPSSPGDANYNADVDLDGFPGINALDIAPFVSMFSKPPGPSGISSCPIS